MTQQIWEFNPLEVFDAEEKSPEGDSADAEEEGGSEVMAETRKSYHPLKCRCPACSDERGDWEYHRRKDEGL